MGFEPKAPRVQLGGMENPGLTSSPIFFNCFSAFFCDEFLSQGRLKKDLSLTFFAETTMGCKRKDRDDLWNIFHRIEDGDPAGRLVEGLCPAVLGRDPWILSREIPPHQKQ